MKVVKFFFYCFIGFCVESIYNRFAGYPFLVGFMTTQKIYVDDIFNRAFIYVFIVSILFPFLILIIASSATRLIARGIKNNKKRKQRIFIALNLLFTIIIGPLYYLIKIQGNFPLYLEVQEEEWIKRYNELMTFIANTNNFRAVIIGAVILNLIVITIYIIINIYHKEDKVPVEERLEN